MKQKVIIKRYPSNDLSSKGPTLSKRGTDNRTKCTSPALLSTSDRSTALATASYDFTVLLLLLPSPTYVFLPSFLSSFNTTQGLPLQLLSVRVLLQPPPPLFRSSVRPEFHLPCPPLPSLPDKPLSTISQTQQTIYLVNTRLAKAHQN